MNAQVTPGAAGERNDRRGATPPPVTRIFSGMQPSGELHIGNYLGALRNWVALQERCPCIYCIVDLHALTQDFPAGDLPARTRDMALGFFAAGIDPERSAVFVQSTRPEHAELAWILGTVTPIGALERMTQYKDKAADPATNVNAGLLIYPVLMTADIALYRADGVPVGDDQIQHLELAREVVRKFNLRYGDVFPEPQPLLTAAPRVLGLDGERKMSKSLGNHIGLNDSPEVVWKKIAPAKTDVRRKRRSDPGVPEECNIFSYHGFFSSPEEREWAAQGCRTAGISCLECKTVVAKNINALLAPMRERRAALEAHPGRLDEILAAGAEKVRPLAEETMDEVRRRIGLPRRRAGGSVR